MDQKVEAGFTSSDQKFIQGFDEYKTDSVVEFLASKGDSAALDLKNFQQILNILGANFTVTPSDMAKIKPLIDEIKPREVFINQFEELLLKNKVQAAQKLLIDIIRDKYGLPNRSGKYEIKDEQPWWKLMRLLQKVPALDKTNIERAKEFVDKFKDEINPGELVLDVGSGGAHVSEQIAAATGAKVFPTDITKPVERVSERGEIQQFVYSSVENLPYKDGAFDKITVVFVLHHLSPDAQVSALKELYRVLKPGGKIIIMEDVPKETESGKAVQNAFDALMNSEKIQEHSYRAPNYWDKFFSEVIGQSGLKVADPQIFGSTLRKDETQHAMFVLEKPAQAV